MAHVNLVSTSPFYLPPDYPFLWYPKLCASTAIEKSPSSKLASKVLVGYHIE